MTAQKLPKCDAICTIRPILSPIHRRFRGYRFVAVTPNLGGTHPRTGERIISFRESYQIAICGDFIYYPDESMAAKFELALKDTFHKIKRIHWHTPD